ncbi:MAG: hypothetical protein SFU99_06860 [Saprospiraceae bacterium]|nr:hypothetical protein [Saprospiraceae bacterium]
MLQIATVSVFLGRAWQHIYWDAPYRTLLWDENWMRPIVTGLFGVSWESYVTTSDQAIQNVIIGIGCFYIICALAAIFIQKLKKIAVIILWLGGLSLILLAALYCKERFFHLGQFFEYTLQWSSSLFLIWLFYKQNITLNIILLIKIAISVTFICHGLYAVGYYPRPAGFMDMTMNILHFNNNQAIIFLKTVGFLDFIAGILLFFPRYIGMIGLLYCIIWGFFTTTARILAHIHIDFIDNFLLQWLHESLYRFPHFLIPLGALFWQMALNRQHLRQF